MSHARSVLAALVACTLLACGDSGPAPIRPANVETIDVTALALLREKIAEVEEDRSSASAHGHLGLAYEANKMWAEAASSFANAQSLDPRDPRWRFHRAIALQSWGDLETALSLYATLEGRLADDVAYRHRYGDALLQAGRTEEALSHFEEVLRLRPTSAEGYVGRGGARLQLERLDAAVQDLEEATRIDPSYRSAHYLLGLVYRELGRTDEARRELALGVGGMIRYLPDELNEEKKAFGVGYGMRMERAHVLLKSGRNREAVEVLEELAGIYPESSDVMNNLASGYRRLGQDQRALGLLEKIHAIDPDEFATLINLAAVRLDMGDLRGAHADARRAVELAPDHRSTRMILGQVLSRMRKFPEARAALERSLELGNTPDGQNLLGEACASMNDFAPAQVAFEEALRLDPAHLTAHLNLCRLYLFQNRFAEAEKVFRAARELAPTSPQVDSMAREIAKRKRDS